MRPSDAVGYGHLLSDKDVLFLRSAAGSKPGIASVGGPVRPALYELAPSPASIWMRSLRYRKSDWIQLTGKLVYSEF